MIVREPIVIVKPVPVQQPAPPKEVQYVVLKPEEPAIEKEVLIAPKPSEKTPDFIAQKLPVPPQNAIKPTSGDAIKSGPNRQTKVLPVLKGKPGRVHGDAELDDILKTMLRDGKAPYGKARQQYNYRSHVRLADLANELVQQGGALHGSFKGKDFWTKWSLAAGVPLQASFYRKFA